MLQSIFANGLRNLGDMSSGVITDTYPDPKKTISSINDILTATILLKTSYKGSNGGF